MMTDADFSTQYRGNYEVRNITIDSGDKIYAASSHECSFVAKLSEKINLTAPTEIYLSSIYIGGYKINESHPDLRHAIVGTDGTPYDDDNAGDVVNYFSIGVSEFNIDTVAGQTSASSTNFQVSDMHRRFNIPLENAATSDVANILQPSDYKPFVLGHLGKTAFYISKIQPKSLDRITVDIRDQDGLSIWKEVVDNPIYEASGNTKHFVDANPPMRSRRVIMQFMLVEKK